MDRLATSYLGLKLKSPVIVGSSSLTSSLDKMKEAEDCGAGAVVMKSLFEEQINYSIASLKSTVDYPESDDYIAFYTRSNAVDEYLTLLGDAVKSLDIPVIPSINCVSSEAWIEFARNIESAGAKALEVNMFFLPVDSRTTASEAEKVYFVLIESLKKELKIPLSLKIGPRFSNILYMIDQFYKRGVEGVVMFNRYFEPDIDPEEISIVSSNVFSTPAEKRYVLRWIAMASALDIKMDISASTGVHSGEDAVRYLLAGADTVQVCSALYSKGIGYLRSINDGIMSWMERKGFNSTDDFRGKLSYASVEKPSVYERSQFMKYFSSHT